MEQSDNGLNLIKSFEGLSTIAYRDVKGVLTIGWGHTGPDVFEGQTITPEQATLLLHQDFLGAANSVNLVLGGTAVTQNQFDALVSLTFNIGRYALSTSTLLKLLRSGDTLGAANQFLSWCHADGKVFQGLVNRRTAERKLFLE